MPIQLQTAMRKNLDQPDEKRSFPNGWMELVELHDLALARVYLQPGWRWSKDVKPLAGTETCQIGHFQYVITGRLKFVMEDGTEMEIGPGDAAVIPPGHDAWVVGDEPFVAVDFSGMREYAKR